jgi:phage gpG-like protein
MVSISVTDNMSPLLKQVMAGCEDMKVPLTRAGLYMFKSFMMQFQARGKPRWKPLSPITIERRRNHSDAPLLDTGRLRRSYVSRGGEGKWSLSNFQLDIGSNLDYAELHQFGGMSRLKGVDFFKLGKNGKYTRTTEAKTKGKVGIARLGDWDDISIIDTSSITNKTLARKLKGTLTKHAAQGAAIPAMFIGLKKARFVRKAYNLLIKVPARPLSIQPDDIINIRTIFERYILGLFGKQGL